MTPPYKILVTISIQERGADWNSAMSTNVLEFDSASEANMAFEKIEAGYPKSAHYAVAVKLY